MRGRGHDFYVPLRITNSAGSLVKGGFQGTELGLVPKETLCNQENCLHELTTYLVTSFI